MLHTEAYVRTRVVVLIHRHCLLLKPVVEDRKSVKEYDDLQDGWRGHIQKKDLSISPIKLEDNLDKAIPFHKVTELIRDQNRHDTGSLT